MIENNKNTNKYPDINLSEKLFDIAKGLIPSQTQTLAKGVTQYVQGVAPIFAQSGKGALITDVDGNEYIDYTMGVGPLILGYSYKAIDDAIIEQLKSGITFSLPHKLEVEVAQLIKQVIPNAENVRFAKSGADATSAAVRLARAYTGKKKILCCGYHGWHDWYISVTDRNNGIPKEIEELSFTFNYNDIQSVYDSIDDEVAAIILEPVTFDKPKDEFLHKLREICTEKNILLIFDEMWTGFRIAVGGSQEFFGIKADLALFYKACANGMPISIITGRADVMNLLEKDVFFYSTFGGEALSLSATKATINEIIDLDVINYIDYIGAKIKSGYNQIANDFGMNYTYAKGYNFRSMVVFDANSHSLILKSILQQELLRYGILWSGFHNISFSHTSKQIDYTLDAYAACLKIVDEAYKSNNPEKYLKGKVIEPVFRKTSNFNTKPKSK